MASGFYSCDKDRLRLSLDDRLSEVEQTELENHLETCPACRQELEQMAAASKLWGDAQLLRGEPIPIRGRSPVKGGGADWVDGLEDDAEDGAPDGGWLEFLDPADPDRPGVLGRIGPYEVVEFLGRGGMGLVLKARDPALDRMVAIKVLTPALAHGATARRRFAREARAVAAVGNEHIVAIHAVNEFRGLPYLVMQYVPGRSLQERLDASGPLEVKEILRIGTQAARALAAAHAQGVVHRDIKPANILLENCIEWVKLSDFGLARAIDDASLTQSGVIAGTPQYMAPEQARGEPVAAAADLFSLGAVLYAMAVGRPPFRADSALAVLKRVCEIRHRPVREMNPEIPDWLEAVIDRLLAKDPADRFQTASEVADLLERGLAHLQQPATVPPPVVPVVNPQSMQLVEIDPAATNSMPRSHRRFALVSALLLLIGAGLGASEAAGLTQVSEFVATILRIKTPEGTLVIKCDDPSVIVRLDGKDLVIASSGLQELRLRTGQHRLAVIKDGRPVRDELVSVARGGKEIVNVSLEPAETALAAERGALPEMSGPPTRATRGASRALAAPRSHVTQCMTCHTNAHAMRADQPLPPGHPPLDLGYRPPADQPVVDNPGSLPDTGRDLLAKGVPQSAYLRGLVWSVAFAPDGNRLAIGQQTIKHGISTLLVWDVAKRSDVAVLARAGSAEYRSVAFSPDGRTLAAGSSDGKLTLWAPESNSATEESQGSPINAVAFLPNSSTVVAGDRDGRVWFYNREGKIDLRHLQYPDRIYALAVSPNGSTIAIAGEARVIQLYDAATRRLKANLFGHTHAIQSLDFSPDGTLLASAGGFNVRVWDVTSGKTSGAQIHHSLEMLCVRFSPDGKTLAISDGQSDPLHSTSLATEIMICDVATRAELLRLRGHTNSIYALAFSPGGKTIASGSVDQTVKLWDAATGQLQQTIVPGESAKGVANPVPPEPAR